MTEIMELQSLGNTHDHIIEFQSRGNSHIHIIDGNILSSIINPASEVNSAEQIIDKEQ